MFYLKSHVTVIAPVEAKLYTIGLLFFVELFLITHIWFLLNTVIQSN